MSNWWKSIMDALDPSRSYLMPVQFGPRPLGKATGFYGDVTSIMVTYLTDAQRLAKHLPKMYAPRGEPSITVQYAMNREVDWLAGRGYNLLQVTTPVHYEGTHDRLDGSLALVLWENLADPILTGRELQGMPKIFGDIPDHSVTDGTWRVEASHFGHQFFGMSVSSVRELSRDEIAAIQAAAKGQDHWMGHRYIPAVGGWGESLSEATVFPVEQTTAQAWIGSGELAWHAPTWEQNPTQHHIIGALAELPILEYRSAIITQGTTQLYPAGRPPRALR